MRDQGMEGGAAQFRGFHAVRISTEAGTAGELGA
jgi:hypothetical protein